MRGEEPPEQKPGWSSCFDCQLRSIRKGEAREAYYIRLVSAVFPIKNGKNFIVKSTKLEKLVLISEWKFAKSTFSGWVRSMLLWVPAFMKIQSRSG